jgi:transposase
MIPKKKNMTVNYPFDKQLYKNRLHVEHTFQKFKTFRRISLRYDKKFSLHLFGFCNYYSQKSVNFFGQQKGPYF